ncbi:MAG: M28 family peptidase [Spirochaetota bacterium]
MVARNAPLHCRRLAGAVLASIMLFATALLPAQAPGRSPIAEERIVSIIEELASPRFGGRLTGSTGNEAAAHYLADTLAEMGARPLPGSSTLFHSYEQPVVTQHGPTRFLLERDNGPTVDLEHGVDFEVIVRDGTRISGEASGEVLELTRARAHAAWVRRHAGAVLLVEATEFEAMTRDAALMSALFGPDGGPAALVLVMPEHIVQIPRSLALRGGAPAAGEDPAAGPYIVNMTARAAGRVRRAMDGPGALTAHVPAAIDNASGVAVAVEAARASGSASRPLWVVLFNGEEQGLYGSRAFVADHARRIEGVVVVNIDMVGHAKDLPVSISATNGGSSVATTLANELRGEGLRTTQIDGGLSDHVAFEGHAPAVSLVQAPYPAMHQRSDTPDRAEPELLARIARAVRAATELLRAEGATTERDR